ncbi:MAG: hypothetical protein AAF264_14660 [Pseudomonadota bacterium]
MPAPIRLLRIIPRRPAPDDALRILEESWDYYCPVPGQPAKAPTAS